MRNRNINRLELELIEATDTIARVREIALGVGQLKSEQADALREIISITEREVTSEDLAVVMARRAGEPRPNGLLRDAVGYAVRQKKKRKLQTKLTKAESALAKAQASRDSIKRELDAVG